MTVHAPAALGISVQLHQGAAGDGLRSESLTDRQAPEPLAIGGSPSPSSSAVGRRVPTLAELERRRRSGEITTDEWIRLLPTAWSCDEPDDTDRAWVDLFTEAREANGGKMLLATYATAGDVRIVRTIEPVAPPWAADEWVDIYRGQQHREDVGVAWTTDGAVAEVYAVRHAWTTDADLWAATGWVAIGRARVRDVLCANPMEGDSEINVDPMLVKITGWREVSVWDLWPKVQRWLAA